MSCPQYLQKKIHALFGLPYLNLNCYIICQQNMWNHAVDYFFTMQSILIDLIETATNDHPFPPSLCSKHVLVLSVQQLHEKLLKLERGSTDWIAEANKCEESLISNVHFCLHKEEISEVSIVCVCQLVRV